LLAFVHIFKTAGTTLTGILRRNFSTRHFDTRLIQEKPAITAAQLKRAMFVYPRIESIAGHAVRPHTDLRVAFPEIRFYTFLRDPRTRLVSSFLFTRAIRIRKGEWRPGGDREIEDAFIGSMTRPRNDYCGILAPDGGDAASAIEVVETKMEFVGLVEQFDESLALLKNWIGRHDFDPAYRRMNDSERRGVEERKFRTVHGDLGRLVRVVRSVAARTEIAEMIAAMQPEDIALYDHVRTETFERMRQRYSAGPGPFSFEDGTVAADTVPGRLYRNLVGRPLVPLIARMASARQVT
jgi:hypothetical protein